MVASNSPSFAASRGVAGLSVFCASSGSVKDSRPPCAPGILSATPLVAAGVSALRICPRFRWCSLCSCPLLLLCVLCALCVKNPCVPKWNASKPCSPPMSLDFPLLLCYSGTVVSLPLSVSLPAPTPTLARIQISAKSCPCHTSAKNGQSDRASHSRTVPNSFIFRPGHRASRATRHSSLGANFFVCHTYENFSSKSFVCHTFSEIKNASQISLEIRIALLPRTLYLALPRG